MLKEYHVVSGGAGMDGIIASSLLYSIYPAWASLLASADIRCDTMGQEIFETDILVVWSRGELPSYYD